MKHLLTIELMPGMVIGEDVLTSDYQLILAKDTVLTDDHITKLTLYEVLSVAIKDEVKLAPSAATEDTTASYSSKLKKTQEFQEFKQNYEVEVESFKNVINSVVEKNAQLDVSSLVNNSLKMIADAKGHFSVLDMLQNMREYDDSTFAHCLNVALLCNVCAGWLGFTDEQIEMATACGLLHDIGKLLVPVEIVTKPGKLTDQEYTVIKRHPVEGYQLLKKQTVDAHICNSALMHHERCDGGGYPLGIKAEQIDPYAKLVAICDVYDAMTAARCYRGPMCPFKVVEIFEKEGLQKYDVNYVLVFLEHTVNSYINNRCRLSDGREGDIIFINKDHLSRPTILCDGKIVDLVKEHDLQIEAIL